MLDPKLKTLGQVSRFTAGLLYQANGCHSWHVIPVSLAKRLNSEQDPQSGIVIVVLNYQCPLVLAVAHVQIMLLKAYYELHF